METDEGYKTYLAYAENIGSFSDSEVNNPLRIIFFPEGQRFLSPKTFVIVFLGDSLLIHEVIALDLGQNYYLHKRVPEQDITDIDGDGNLEIRAFTWAETGVRFSINVLEIYRYIVNAKECDPRFVKS